MSNHQVNLAAVLPAPATNLEVQERQIPVPGPEEVVIRTHAIGINPIDWKRQSFGLYCSSYPIVLGADASGVVHAVGSSVTTFKPGDRVFTFAHSLVSGNNDNGAYQSYIASMAGMTVRLPDNWSFAQGATLPTATGTSMLGLFDRLGLALPTVTASGTTSALEKGKAILIWGGASTVGSMMIQFARLSGLTVFATASEKHHAELKLLGASFLVDYKSPNAVEQIISAANQADVQLTIAVDTIAQAGTLSAVAEVLQSAGAGPGVKTIAHTVPWPTNELPVPEGIVSKFISGEEFWGPRRDLADWLCSEGGALPKWLAQGAIVPKAHRVVGKGLENLQLAMDELKKGAVSGEKLVVEV